MVQSQVSLDDVETGLRTSTYVCTSAKPSHRVQITGDQVIARQVSFTRVCQPYHLGYNFAFLRVLPRFCLLYAYGVPWVHRRALS